MTDPEECLALAEQCVVMANHALNSSIQCTLLQMAAAWAKLADELDQNASLWKRLVGRTIYPDTYTSD
jgi:hypothetical protein